MLSKTSLKKSATVPLPFSRGAYDVSSNADCDRGRATTACWRLCTQVCCHHNYLLPSPKLAISIRTPDPRHLIFTCENTWSCLQIHCTTRQRTDTCRSAAPVPLVQEDAVMLRMATQVSILPKKRECPHFPGAALRLSACCPREGPSPQRSLHRAAFITPSGRPRCAVYTLGEGKTYARRPSLFCGMFYQEVAAPTRHGPALLPLRQQVTGDTPRGGCLARQTKPAGRCHPGCRCNQRRTPSGWLNIEKLSRTAKGQHFAIKAYFRQRDGLRTPRRERVRALPESIVVLSPWHRDSRG